MTARIKICVTGGAGFIGSSFVLSAIKIGCEVLVLDKLTYAASDNNLSQVWDNSLFKFVQKDICDYESLYVAIAKFKPDFIVNFAAESHVDNSIYDPKVFLDSNIYGTYNILEVLRNLKSTRERFSKLNPGRSRRKGTRRNRKSRGTKRKIQSAV